MFSPIRSDLVDRDLRSEMFDLAGMKFSSQIAVPITRIDDGLFNAYIVGASEANIKPF